MLPNLPAWIYLTFVIATGLTVFLFYRAASNSKKVLIVLLVWLLLQAAISWSGFYLNTAALPPRFTLTLIPGLIVIVFLLLTKKGKDFTDSLNTGMLVLLSIIRIPVEFVLYGLFLQKAIPELMTFTGRNFDIIAGITAPFIYFICFRGKEVIKSGLLLLWNFISFGLLLNIVINAVFSLPSPFQRFAFEQPNIALLYFPFVWLASCIVPLVLFSHLVLIRKLMFVKNETFAIH
jgi:hypothetical protein